MRGNVQIDLAKRQVTRNGHTIHLTPTEYRLLVALLAARGHPVSPEVLVARVWGEEGARSLDNLKSYISYLRQKIEPDPEQPQIILNARGFGYLLAETLP